MVTRMTTTAPTAAIAQSDTIEVRPIFAGAALCEVLLNGTVVGEVLSDKMVVGAKLYRFADQAAAIEAVISRHRSGYWYGEL